MQTDSPFKRLRLAVGQTGAEFALEAEISRQSVTNLEAGMYAITPLRANRALSRLCRDRSVSARDILRDEYGEESLDKAMDRWKREKRKRTDLSEWPRMTLNQIVKQFDSPGTFCRDLCIPTAALYNVTVRHTAVPLVIQQALHDAGYRFDDWTVE